MLAYQYLVLSLGQVSGCDKAGFSDLRSIISFWSFLRLKSDLETYPGQNLSNPAMELLLIGDLATDGQLDASASGYLRLSIGKLQHGSWFLSRSKTVVG